MAEIERAYVPGKARGIVVTPGELRQFPGNYPFEKENIWVLRLAGSQLVRSGELHQPMEKLIVKEKAFH